MPRESTVHKNNPIYIQLKKDFGSVLAASKQLGFSTRMMWHIVQGRPITEATRKRLKAARYSKLTKLIDKLAPP